MELPGYGELRINGRPALSGLGIANRLD